MTGWKPVFRLGTRKSPLAMAQTAEALAALKKKFPSINFKIVPVSTLGDEYQSVEIFKRRREGAPPYGGAAPSNDWGVFTKAIEKQLLAGRIDLAVHSLKDLPTKLSKGLRLAAVLKRADTADVLITKKRHSLESLPMGARIGTGSLRRQEQLKRLRPDLRVEALRGNLGSRIAKVLKERRLDAVIIASAGLGRLKFYSKFSRRISEEVILPAVGQGAIALQVRSADKTALRLAAAVNHRPTELAVRAERAFLNKLRGGCRVPIGVLTKISNGKIRIKGTVFSVSDDRILSAVSSGALDRPENTGRVLAKKLIQKGASKLLKEARR